MKIYRKTSCSLDRKLLQDDIDKVVGWTDDWVLKVNIAEYKVLTLGKGEDSSHKCYINSGGNLHALYRPNVSTERDLGGID